MHPHPDILCQAKTLITSIQSPLFDTTADFAGFSDFFLFDAKRGAIYL